MNRPRSFPFFVYGTLRPGHRNYIRLLEGQHVGQRRAFVKGHRLYVDGVPYAVPAERFQNVPHLVGALIEVAEDRYDEVLANLDALEGYDPQNPERSHYRRVLVTATGHTPLVGGGTFETYHRAWIYIAGPRFDRQNATPIPSGDWERAAEEIAVQRRRRWA